MIIKYRRANTATHLNCTCHNGCQTVLKSDKTKNCSRLSTQFALNSLQLGKMTLQWICVYRIVTKMSLSSVVHVKFKSVNLGISIYQQILSKKLILLSGESWVSAVLNLQSPCNCLKISSTPAMRLNLSFNAIIQSQSTRLKISNLNSTGKSSVKTPKPAKMSSQKLQSFLRKRTVFLRINQRKGSMFLRCLLFARAMILNSLC